LDAETKFELLSPPRLIMWGSSPVNWSLRRASVWPHYNRYVYWMRVITYNMQTRLYGSYLTMWKLAPNVNCPSVWLLMTTYIITFAVR